MSIGVTIIVTDTNNGRNKSAYNHQFVVKKFFGRSLGSHIGVNIDIIIGIHTTKKRISVNIIKKDTK